MDSLEISLEDIFAPDFFEETDINQLFHDATTGVLSDEDLALEEKVTRVEKILKEANSEEFREFIDFRSMAAQIQFMCGHDHSLQQGLQGNDAINDFLHNHSSEQESDKEKEAAKKKKRKHGWLAFLFTEA